MKPIWLIERGVYRDHAAAVLQEVRRQGMQGYEVDYRPGKPPPQDIAGCPNLAENSCVVLWSTLPLFQQIRLHRRWIPAGWCSVDRLECAAYYPHFARYLLNHPHRILFGAEAVRSQAELFAELGGNDELFVRPNTVQKLFPGGVVYIDDFADRIAAARYDPEARIVVAPPRELGCEWRFVIAGDEIVAASQYRDRGAIQFQQGCPAEVTQFVHDLLKQVRWRPDPIFMLDVCEAEDRLWLLELNSFSCSGIYDCDVPAIVRAASEVAEREWASQ